MTVGAAAKARFDLVELAENKVFSGFFASRHPDFRVEACCLRSESGANRAKDQESGWSSPESGRSRKDEKQHRGRDGSADDAADRAVPCGQRTPHCASRFVPPAAGL